MALRKVSVFLAKHSQKIALLTSVTGVGIAYAIQPRYEVFVRWVQMKTHGQKELTPSERIRQVTNAVCEQFDLSDDQKARLDVFLVGFDQSVPLGSLVSGGYAFIGLPFFATYSDSSEIPAQGGFFYTPQFPYGPYSPLGKQLMDLVVLSESMLRFLIARELVRLGAKPKNITESTRSARFKSMVTVTGIIGGLYASYQSCYFLNRALRLPTRISQPARILSYSLLTALGLFCQWQAALAWRRSWNFQADRVVAHMDPALLEGGLLYYDWRLRYNRFCYDRMIDLLAQTKAHKRKESSVDFDPLQAYQDEQAALEKAEKEKSGQPAAGREGDAAAVKSSSTAVEIDAAGRNVVRDQQSGYFVPRVDGVGQSACEEPSRSDASSLHLSSYKIHPRLEASGNERWAADGDALGFGLTDLLALGYVWSPLAFLFSVFSVPATSETRLARLKALAHRIEPES